MIKDTGSERHRVRDLVTRHLPANGFDFLPLNVVEDEMRKDGDWWFVPVRPAVKPQRPFQFYEVLADLDEALEQEDHLDVILVPVYPD